MRFEKVPTTFCCIITLLMLAPSAYAQSSTTQDVVNALQSNIESAQSLKNQFIESPHELIRSLPRQGETFSGPLLPHATQVSRTLAGAVPFVGCVGDTSPVFGYLNIAQHLWFFVWLDEKRAIKDARISLGLPLKVARKNSRWTDYWNDETADNLAQAMQRSFDVQIMAFEKLFSYSNCPNVKDVEFLFQESAALKSVVSMAQDFSEVDSSIRTQILEINASGSDGLFGKRNLVFSFLQNGGMGVDVFSIVVPKNVPGLSLVQGWKQSDNGVVLAYEEIVKLKVE